MLEEFKKFAMRGDVLDMAVGVIMGAAFGKIVTSLVNDIIMPPVGKILGGVNFTNLFVSLSSEQFASLAEAQKAGAPVLAYGNFLQTIFDFLIISFSIFLMIRTLNRLKKKEEEKPVAPKPSPEIELLSEIRDLLKSK